ncbi:MAG: hypothetical protein JXJ04_17860 [Spirochaetales bacterium]|nr:hypothetical protein [Spirochaetales bacterium]
MKKIILIVISIFIAGTALYAEAEDTEILQRLGGHLESIAIDAQLSREIGGGVLIGSGILLGSMGFILPALSVYDEENAIFSTFFFSTGTVCTLGGVLVLLFPSDYEKLPRKFAEMPETTIREREAKITKGEVYLRSLSTKSRDARYLSAGISAAMSAAAFIYYFTTPPDPYDSTFRDTFLYEGITFLGSSIVTYVIKSKPENEYNAYLEWKNSRGIAKQGFIDMNKDFSPVLISIRGGIGISFRYN